MRPTVAIKSRRSKETGFFEPTKVYFLDGVEVTKEEFDARMPSKQIGRVGSGNYLTPLTLDMALFVDPSQIPEVLERNAKAGLKIDYTPDGFPIVRSQQERNKLMELEGAFDRDACYGDRTRS